MCGPGGRRASGPYVGPSHAHLEIPRAWPQVGWAGRGRARRGAGAKLGAGGVTRDLQEGKGPQPQRGSLTVGTTQSPSAAWIGSPEGALKEKESGRVEGGG